MFLFLGSDNYDMVETLVRLVCPGCSKDWQESPSDLPRAGADFDCPNCGESRRLSEFAHTERDLETLQQFQS